MQELINFFNHHPLLCITTVAVFIAVVFIEWYRTKHTSFNLSPREATKLINQQQAVVIDIRGKEAFKQGHIINAHHYDAQTFTADAKKLEKFRNDPIIIIGANKQEGDKVTVQLRKKGYNAFSLAHGITGWLDADMPLVKE